MDQISKGGHGEQAAFALVTGITSVGRCERGGGGSGEDKVQTGAVCTGQIRKVAKSVQGRQEAERERTAEGMWETSLDEMYK